MDITVMDTTITTIDIMDTTIIMATDTTDTDMEEDILTFITTTITITTTAAAAAAAVAAAAVKAVKAAAAARARAPAAARRSSSIITTPPVGLLPQAHPGLLAAPAVEGHPNLHRLHLRTTRSPSLCPSPTVAAEVTATATTSPSSSQPPDNMFL
ncbi:angiomotin-like [Haliotis asinina]|uniref:angiomotin-like n=1 Tax=Haliotis asinina TaxID=109174 RepID=UPI0035322056